MSDSLLSSCVSLSTIQIANRRAIARWLVLVLVMLFAIVLVGGATRMTGSGLSITEWKPIHGVLPPIGEAQWREEFEKYQQIAQYVHLNQGMNLGEFKFIFWWEWIHRLLARLVGVVILMILGIFALQKRLEKVIAWRLLAIGALIGLQGVIGWWMVYSGLGDSDLTHVSQYRLAIHLVAASVTIIAVTCTICYLVQKRQKETVALQSKILRYSAAALVLLILFQIYLGALVAGIHAGHAYNSWPLMDGQWIPDGLFMLRPFWLNFFENTLTVQFIHRLFAYFLALFAFFHAVTTKWLWPSSIYARQAQMLLILIIVQAIFGIITLLTFVPIEWGLIHQGVALLVLCFASFHWQNTKSAI